MCQLRTRDFSAKSRAFSRVAFPKAQSSQPVEGRALGFGTPGGFVEGIEGFFILSFHGEGQSEVEIALSVVGIGVAEGLFVDCFLEIGDGFLRVTSSEEEKAVAIVQPEVCGIPAQAFEIIVRRLIGRVAVLLQMKGGEIELFGGGDVFRHFHDAGWFRDGLKLRSFDFMGDQKNGAIGNG